MNEDLVRRARRGDEAAAVRIAESLDPDDLRAISNDAPFDGFIRTPAGALEVQGGAWSSAEDGWFGPVLLVEAPRNDRLIQAVGAGIISPTSEPDMLTLSCFVRVDDDGSTPVKFEFESMSDYGRTSIVSLVASDPAMRAFERAYRQLYAKHVERWLERKGGVGAFRSWVALKQLRGALSRRESALKSLRDSEHEVAKAVRTWLDAGGRP